MADQVEGLIRSRWRRRARLDPTRRSITAAPCWRQIEAGTLDLLYLSPEGLMQPAMLDRLVRSSRSA